MVPEHTPYTTMDTDGDGEIDYVYVADDGDGIVDFEDNDINGDGHPDSFGIITNDDMPMESNHTDAGMQNAEMGPGE